MAKRSRENVYCAEAARYVFADGNAIAGVTLGAQSSLADAILDVVDLLRGRNRMRTCDMSSSLAESKLRFACARHCTLAIKSALVPTLGKLESPQNE